MCHIVSTIAVRLLRCGRLLRCRRGVCHLGVLAVEAGAAAAAGAKHLLDLDGRRLSARPCARRSVSSRSMPILMLSCTSFWVELVCGNPIQNSSGSARDARRVSLRFAWGCVPTQPFGPRGEFCPGPGCSIIEPSAKTRVLSGFRPSATTRRSSRHKRRRSLVASSCQRTRRDTQARVRPVANLLQLCGGSRRPWLWVGGYDRTAWVLTMLLARLSCVRPKAVSGRGLNTDVCPYQISYPTEG